MIGYLILLSAFLGYSLVALWPATATAGGTAPTVVSVSFLGGTFVISDETRLLLLVVVGGAFGSLVHAVRSLYWYVGHRQLIRSWLPMYILLPYNGTVLALVFYLLIRGGFFSPQATSSPFSFVALAVLVGMFSAQAVIKLKDIAETVFAKPKPGTDAVRQNGASGGPDTEGAKKPA